MNTRIEGIRGEGIVLIEEDDRLEFLPLILKENIILNLLDPPIILFDSISTLVSHLS